MCNIIAQQNPILATAIVTENSISDVGSVPNPTVVTFKAYTEILRHLKFVYKI